MCGKGNGLAKNQSKNMIIIIVNEARQSKHLFYSVMNSFVLRVTQIKT